MSSSSEEVSELTMVAGLGDEVVIFLVGVLSGVALLLAWWSTEVRERPRVEAVLVRQVRPGVVVAQEVARDDPRLVGGSAGAEGEEEELTPATTEQEEEDEDQNSGDEPESVAGSITRRRIVPGEGVTRINTICREDETATTSEGANASETPETAAETTEATPSTSSESREASNRKAISNRDGISPLTVKFQREKCLNITE